MTGVVVIPPGTVLQLANTEFWMLLSRLRDDLESSSVDQTSEWRRNALSIVDQASALQSLDFGSMSAEFVEPIARRLSLVSDAWRFEIERDGHVAEDDGRRVTLRDDTERFLSELEMHLHDLFASEHGET